MSEQTIREVGMTHFGPWHVEDFELLNWHDVHVHGFRLDAFLADEGASDLVLDLDYILKWHNTDKGFEFTVCQAELRFHRVFGLKFALDYSTPTAGMCPFSIDGIYREVREHSTGFKSFLWRIPINWPQGSIEFEAPSFTQRLIGEPIVQPAQSLSPEQRRAGMAIK